MRDEDRKDFTPEETEAAQREALVDASIERDGLIARLMAAESDLDSLRLRAERAEGERDRYRAALETIANGPICHCTYEAGDTADCPSHPTDENANPINEPWFDERDIAKSALGEGKCRRCGLAIEDGQTAVSIRSEPDFVHAECTVPSDDGNIAATGVYRVTIAPHEVNEEDAKALSLKLFRTYDAEWRAVPDERWKAVARAAIRLGARATKGGG